MDLRGAADQVDRYALLPQRIQHAHVREAARAAAAQHLKRNRGGEQRTIKVPLLAGVQARRGGKRTTTIQKLAEGGRGWR